MSARHEPAFRTARCAALVSAAAISANCRRIGAGLGEGTRLCAVVKADGYGHGAERAARAALDGGASWLGVVTAEEALSLRTAIGPEVPILIMGPLHRSEVEVAVAASAELGAWDEETVVALSEAAQGRNSPVAIHLKHDSGMGRFGVREPERLHALAELCDRLEGVRLAGIWTHFATADEDDAEFLNRQLRSFERVVDELRQRHPGILVHAANSAATLSEPAAHFDMVRCGVAIYGLDPFQGDPAERGLEPALELRSHLAQVKRLEAGDSVGYGRHWRAPTRRAIGLVPVGYGDGLMRGLSGRAEAIVDGVRRPLVGTISMDSVACDLGPDGDAGAAVGAEAVLIGKRGSERILAEDLARRLGTINYEVTCAISPRVPRVDRDPGPAA